MGLIVRNPLHATVLDNSSTFIIWMCRLIVVGASVGLSYGVFYLWDEELTSRLNNPFVPIIIIAIGAYIVSQPFFLVHRFVSKRSFDGVKITTFAEWPLQPLSCASWRTLKPTTAPRRNHTQIDRLRSILAKSFKN